MPSVDTALLCRGAVVKYIECSVQPHNMPPNEKDEYKNYKEKYKKYHDPHPTQSPLEIMCSDAHPAADHAGPAGTAVEAADEAADHTASITGPTATTVETAQEAPKGISPIIAFLSTMVVREIKRNK